MRERVAAVHRLSLTCTHACRLQQWISATLCAQQSAIRMRRMHWTWVCSASAALPSARSAGCQGCPAHPARGRRCRDIYTWQSPLNSVGGKRYTLVRRHLLRIARALRISAADLASSEAVRARLWANMSRSMFGHCHARRVAIVTLIVVVLVREMRNMHMPVTLQMPSWTFWPGHCARSVSHE